ncbi:hypothetical protein A3C23_04300 [Candidatus Roizmanbacteria bacterium RIFCSPHIGHO2_02_FULL_37_13b]|uniref:YprB ribonuclease H-like domain-containing protein n=1 Tax=Candidatus Roizmanbacteria bacterium RIFCSPLOWO2_02_FULL_36_11 TaxID=1802071 RepID=A0A1F7JH39_9BACT|nr:MAG: hypothetical protein A3C23_04300 [Candidatus Roizmanbacteria bacterium RIFCSPHIGHO2_02_FULL_37_13b]OGK54931.1 MAG: hypothetical protein A3H78_00445 [Candidatus Roizmanbacteria bacterium RIFCSPLOWO2_02_FULL_36_11]
MRYPIVLDLETKHSFREFSDPKKLGISVLGIFDYHDNQLKAFFESELNTAFPLLENASILIGFNINSFDLPVLQGYYPGRTEQFKTFDILDDIKNKLGRRLALNDIVSATLNKKKSGHGLAAIDYYREGQLDKLKSYCLSDVSLTKELFEYGVKEKKIFYPHLSGKMELKVTWEKSLSQSNDNDVSLTLPF